MCGGDLMIEEGNSVCVCEYCGSKQTVTKDEQLLISKTTLESEGIETKIFHIGSKDIRGCIACNTCVENKKCILRNLGKS